MGGTIMQTVQFQCGHCGKTMGVSTEFLGRHVRCPHCQQVVVAPSPAPTPEPTPAPPAESAPAPQESLGLVETVLHTPVPIADPEDIFSPNEASEDLFGRAEAPRIELPPDPLAPTVTVEGGFQPAHSEAEPTLAFSVPPPAGADPSAPAGSDGTAVLLSSGGESPWLGGATTELLPPAPAEAPAGAPQELPGEAPSAPRPARRKEPGTPWFMILVFSPLLLYSIVITVFAVLLYMQERDVEQQLQKRFEMMPDEGDNPGVQKGKKVSRQIYRYDPKVATLPLPEHLCTTLSKSGGQPLRIGDLQVTPVKVERKRVKVFVEGSERPEPCLGDSLVLYLALKNLSSEYAFAPLDNYFDRSWQPGLDQLPPFTQLEADNKHRFYGGPAKWFPRGTTKERREWVEGRKGFEAELLQPGKEKQFFVCTDGSDPKAVLALFGVNKGEQVREPYHGPFLWRIRLRRGLVTINDKEYSATAVVGVKFTDADIQTGGG
jgi:hypothetical protein